MQIMFFIFFSTTQASGAANSFCIDDRSLRNYCNEFETRDCFAKNDAGCYERPRSRCNSICDYDRYDDNCGSSRGDYGRRGRCGRGGDRREDSYIVRDLFDR
ncbi:hypothetical protein COBT_003398, partial [Conglomerata obtusa]